MLSWRCLPSTSASADEPLIQFQTMTQLNDIESSLMRLALDRVDSEIRNDHFVLTEDQRRAWDKMQSKLWWWSKGESITIKP